jgi:DNA adenine methylase
MALLDDLFDSLGYEEKRVAFTVPAFCMPGSKVRSLDVLIPELEKLIIPSTIWVDHFGGSGAVSWNVPKCANMVFNDAWSAITDFYKCFLVRADLDRLIDTLERFPASSRQMWDHCDKTWVDDVDPIVRAAKWFYMTKGSVLQKGKIFGRGLKSRNIRFPGALEPFEELHRVISNFTLESLDVFTLIKDYDSEDTLHFFDPPYIESDQSAYRHTWCKEQMVQLLDLIPNLKGRVAMTHYPNTMLDQRDWSYKRTWSRKSYTEPVSDLGLDGKSGKSARTKNHEEECLYVRS